MCCPLLLRAELLINSANRSGRMDRCKKNPGHQHQMAGGDQRRKEYRRLSQPRFALLSFAMQFFFVCVAVKIDLCSWVVGSLSPIGHGFNLNFKVKDHSFDSNSGRRRVLLYIIQAKYSRHGVTIMDSCVADGEKERRYNAVPYPKAQEEMEQKNMGGFGYNTITEKKVHKDIRKSVQRIKLETREVMIDGRGYVMLRTFH